MTVSLQQLSEIFSSVFDEEIILNADSCKENLAQWDSLKHLYLILELEEQLNVQFTTSEIEQMTSVRQILQVLQIK